MFQGRGVRGAVGTGLIACLLRLALVAPSWQPASFQGSAPDGSLPSEPSIVSVISGSDKLTVQYTEAANSPTSYTAQCGAESETVSGQTTWATVSGLSNSLSYNCTVDATNSSGTGPKSAPAPGTPEAVSTAPTAAFDGYLQAVSCPTAKVCVAVGAGGTDDSTGLVEASTDGGKTFTDEPIPTNTPPLEAVTCPSSDECLAVGGDIVLSTRNGGSTWYESFVMENLASVACVSVKRCIVSGPGEEHENQPAGYFDISADGGRSWRETLDVPDMAYASDLTCVTDTCIALGGPPQFLYATTNGGKSWSGRTVKGGIPGRPVDSGLVFAFHRDLSRRRTEPTWNSAGYLDRVHEPRCYLGE